MVVVKCKGLWVYNHGDGGGQSSARGYGCTTTVVVVVKYKEVVKC
jgi:hypothetical protein